MKNSAKRNGKRLLAVLVTCASICTFTKPLPVLATETATETEIVDIVKQEQIKTAMSDVIIAMQTCVNENYEKEIENIKKDIHEKGYDYYTTLESITVTGNPIWSINYADLVCAYISACTEYGKLGIYNIDFFDYTITESSFERTIPYKNNLYEKLSNGNYKKVGIEYLQTNCVVPEYQMLSNGEFELIGEKEVVLEKEIVKYGVVTFSTYTGQQLLEKLGVAPDSDIYKDYQRRYAILEKAYADTGTDVMEETQTIQLEITRSNPTTDVAYAYVNDLLSQHAGTNMGVILEVATYLIDKVPYQWGGKSKKEGFDEDWYTFDKVEGNFKGLDCSGYIQWVFRTAGYPSIIWEDLLSTSSILATQETIDESELQIGDLGLLNHGEDINHVGMYLGEGYWIHCNSSANGVSVDQTTMFTIFKRVFNMSNSIKLEPIGLDNNAQEEYYSFNELCNLAYYIQTLSPTNNNNAWIDLTQVCLNRLESSDYPNTIDEVLTDITLYGINKDELNMEEPTEELIEVIKSVLNKTVTSTLPAEADSVSTYESKRKGMELIKQSNGFYFYNFSWQN